MVSVRERTIPTESLSYIYIYIYTRVCLCEYYEDDLNSNWLIAYLNLYSLSYGLLNFHITEFVYNSFI
jgi:hypothetical protein